MKDMSVPTRLFFERWGFEDIPDVDGWTKIKCAIHGERRPSGRINPIEGAYRCLSCGVGGDLIKMVMEVEKVDFNGALALYERVVGEEYGSVSGSASGKRRGSVPTRRARFEQGNSGGVSSGIRRRPPSGGRRVFGED